MIGNWSDPFVLTTPRGSLTFNALTGSRYILLNESCDAGADLRFTSDNIPQSDGQTNHRQYLTGYKMRLAASLWKDSAAACGDDAQTMIDMLESHLDALRNPTGTTRIVWTPEGKAARMANDIDLVDRPLTTVVPRRSDGLVAVTFGVCSPFPYAMSEAEQTPNSLTDGAPATLTNLGSTRTWPVFKVHGPTWSFTIENADDLDTDGNAKVFVYDGSRPGASMIGTSEYVELDFFRGTAFLNGDQDNMHAGIDVNSTDLWALNVGANDITITGADADVLWHHGWL